MLGRAAHAARRAGGAGQLAGAGKNTTRHASTTSKVTSPTDWAGIVVLSGIVGVTSYLAVWQTQRYHWKVDLLAKRAAGLAGEPSSLHTALAGLPTDPKRVQFETAVPVTVSGQLDLSHQVLVGPRAPPADSPPGTPRQGFYVLCPLVLDNSTATLHQEAPLSNPPSVLVNLGWVPPDGGALASATTPMQVTLSGILRGGEGGGDFAPPHTNDASFGWFDLPSIAAVMPQPPVRPPGASFFDTPFAIDATAAVGPDGAAPPLGIPKPLSAYGTVSTHPATHAAYAVTWAALAVAGTAMTWRRFNPRPATGAALFAAAQARALMPVVTDCDPADR